MLQKRNLFTALIVICVIFSGCSPTDTDTKMPALTPDNTSGAPGQNIVDLLEQEVITFKITSGAINELGLNIENKTGQAQHIDIPAGTYFVNLDPNFQNMVILHQTSIFIQPFDQVDIQLDAACANLHLTEPTQENTFTIERTPNSISPLLNLIVNKLNTVQVDYPIEQAAVWIMTDNSTFDELGMLVGGSRFGTSIINENDAVQAMMLIDDAGLNIRDYAIWEDRMQLVGKVNEPGLNTWLENLMATQVFEDATNIAQEENKSLQKETLTPQPSPSSTADEISQFALSATASSQYSEPNWSAMQAVNTPDTSTCGDNKTAWATKTSTGKDWLLLKYDMAVIPSKLVIFETYNPGAISLVEVLDEGGNPIIVYEAVPTIIRQCPNVLEIDITDVSVPVRTVRVSIDQSNHDGWDEIDAVQLIGRPFPYALTVNKYHETDDLDSACKNELGSTWRIADYNNIILEYSQSENFIQDIVNVLAFTKNSPYWITNNGENWYSGTRHYLLEFHKHNLPSGWLSHADLDNHYLDLGSWYGIEAEVLCKLK